MESNGTGMKQRQYSREAGRRVVTARMSRWLVSHSQPCLGYTQM